jgi:hypothetical protein
MRLSTGKFGGGAVEDANPPDCLVSRLSKWYETQPRKRKNNGFHPHDLSTQRNADRLCETKLVKPFLHGN